jgi:UDP-glucose 4-epimerase
LGRYVVKELVADHVGLRVFDTEECQQENVESVVGDALDLGEVESAAEGIDVVIHLVGVRDAHVAEASPDLSFRLNVLSLHNVLEACRVRKVKRLLFPSSASVYGRTDTIPVSEEDPLRPTGIYAYHKWLCEELIRSYRATYGLNYVIFRLFNAYGPGNANILHRCIVASKQAEPITIFGADQLRDFVFIGDVARAFSLAVLSRQLENRTLNLGTGKGRTIRGIANVVAKEFPGLQAVFEEKPGFVPYHSVADVTLARTLLGFVPENSEELFRKAIRAIGETL